MEEFKNLNENTVFKRVDADRVFIINIADAHVGSMHHNQKALEATIKLVKNTPNMFVMIGGDITEHATTTSKSSVFEEECHGIDQVYKIRDLLLPIKEKILFVRSGNHGHGRAMKHNKIAPEQVLSALLEVPFLTGITTAIINARKNCYVLTSIHHGRSDKQLAWLGADVIFVEHLHRQGGVPKKVATMNKFTKKWMFRPVHIIYAGSFLEYGGYAAERAYEPLYTGSPIIELSGIKEDWNIYIWDKIENFKKFNKDGGK